MYFQHPGGITARSARIGRDSSHRLRRHRWVIEGTLGWLLSWKCLALRCDRSVATITALARLAVTLNLRPAPTAQQKADEPSRRLNTCLLDQLSLTDCPVCSKLKE